MIIYKSQTGRNNIIRVSYVHCRFYYPSIIFMFVYHIHIVSLVAIKKYYLYYIAANNDIRTFKCVTVFLIIHMYIRSIVVYYGVKIIVLSGS